MDDILTIVGVLAALFVFVQALVFVMSLSRYVKVALRPGTMVQAGPGDAGEMGAVLDTVAATLREQGFAFQHRLRIVPMIAAAGMPDAFGDVYYHHGHRVCATVQEAGLPDPSRLCDISLTTRFDDGSTVMTVNHLAHTLLPFPVAVALRDARAPDFAGQLKEHLRACAQRAAAPTGPGDLVADASQFAAQLLPQLEREGHVYRRDGDGQAPRYGLKLKAAFKIVLRQRAYAWSRNKPPAVAADFGAARQSAERSAFQRILCTLRAMRAPRWFAHLAFCLSALAFLGIGAWLWGWTGALVIALVLLLHEAGHWAAMKLAGFRDVQVFFVPGLGAATSGEKHEASPFTHLAVYLAGPLPGVLLALGIFAWAAGSPAQAETPWYPIVLAVGATAFVLNMFNLLPVLPLDGGRVLELFVMGRLPWLRFVFSLLSSLAFIGAAFYSGDTILYVIGFALLLASQQQYFVAYAGARLVRAGPERATSAGLYDFFTQPAFAAWPFQRKLAVGIALLPRVHGRLPSWKEAVGALAIYGACILAPLAVVAGLIWHAPSGMLAAYTRSHAAFSKPADVTETVTADADAQLESYLAQSRKQRAQAFAAATTPQARRAALLTAIDDADEAEDTEDLLRLSTMLYAQTRDDPPDSRERARAAYLLANATDREGSGTDRQNADAARWREEARGILSGRVAGAAEPGDVRLLGDVLQAQAYAGEPQTQIERYRALVALYVAHPRENEARRAFARRDLARSLDTDGQRDAADAEMRSALADIEAAQSDDQYAPRQMRVMAGWMLLDHGKPGEAAQLVKADLGASAAEQGRTNEYFSAYPLAWAVARHQKDWAGARRYANRMAAPPPASGNWLQDWLSGWLRQPDYRSTLMQIEAERALGEHVSADKRLAAINDGDEDGKAPMCKVTVYDSGWARSYLQALHDIERRELDCEPPPPPLKCATPQLALDGEEED